MRKRLFALLLAALALCGCAKTAPAPADAAQSSRMELRYADQFTVESRADGCALVTIGGADRFLLVPEGAQAGAEPGVTVLHTPLQKLYVAS